MITISRDSGTPSFLAPRVACESFEQRIAEDESRLDDIVCLGNDWWYDRMQNALVRIMFAAA